MLRVNDIMAYSRLSGDDVLSNIFVDEETFDDSDSESGDDVYGYLGARAIPRGELIEESYCLTGGVDETENGEGSREDTLSDSEEESVGDSYTNYSDTEDHHDATRHEDDASSSSNVDVESEVERLSQCSNEVHMDEVVSETEAVLNTLACANRVLLISYITTN